MTSPVLPSTKNGCKKDLFSSTTWVFQSCLSAYGRGVRSI